LSNPRAHLGQIIMAAGGALLFISTFLSWGGDASAWESFSFLDIVIAFGALATAALAVAHITGSAEKIPPALRGDLPNWVGLIPATLAAGILLEAIFGPGELDFGGWIALLASLAIIAGLVLRERPDLAAKVNEATANIGSGGAHPGAGPGAPAAPGGYAQQPAPPAGAGPAAPATPPSPASPSPTVAQPVASPTPQPVASPQPAASPDVTQQAPQPESSGPAPGWYPDPQGQKRLRYWDGGRWTEQTAD
jgi:hypothetical protein